MFLKTDCTFSADKNANINFLIGSRAVSKNPLSGALVSSCSSFSAFSSISSSLAVVLVITSVAVDFGVVIIVGTTCLVSGFASSLTIATLISVCALFTFLVEVV